MEGGGGVVWGGREEGRLGGDGRRRDDAEVRESFDAVEGGEGDGGVGEGELRGEGLGGKEGGRERWKEGGREGRRENGRGMRKRVKERSEKERERGDGEMQRKATQMCAS